MESITSDRSVEFAKQVYGETRARLEEAIAQGPGSNKPVLLAVGEYHMDVKGTYAEVSALQAAEDLVGKDKVKLSIETDKNGLMVDKFVLNQKIENQDNSNYNGEKLISPSGDPKAFFSSMRYAMERDIAVVEGDPKIRDSANLLYEKLDNGESITSINDLHLHDLRDNAINAKLAETGKSMGEGVHVSIGGAAHLTSLEGNKLNEQDYSLSKGVDGSPVKDAHSSIIKVNTVSASIMNEMPSSDAKSYIANPENAMQIRPSSEFDSLSAQEIVRHTREGALSWKNDHQALKPWEAQELTHLYNYRQAQDHVKEAYAPEYSKSILENMEKTYHAQDYSQETYMQGHNQAANEEANKPAQADATQERTLPASR